MFKWLKQLLKKDSPPVAAAPAMKSSEQETTPGAKKLSSGEILSRYLSANPSKSTFDVPGLIAAGGADAATPLELGGVREKIVRLGYRDPINPTLQQELSEDELLDFLRWHSNQPINRDDYRDENTIHALIRRFRASQE